MPTRLPPPPIFFADFLRLYLLDRLLALFLAFLLFEAFRADFFAIDYLRENEDLKELRC